MEDPGISECLKKSRYNGRLEKISVTDASNDNRLSPVFVLKSKSICAQIEKCQFLIWRGVRIISWEQNYPSLRIRSWLRTKSGQLIFKKFYIKLIYKISFFEGPPLKDLFWYQARILSANSQKLIARSIIWEGCYCKSPFI